MMGNIREGESVEDAIDRSYIAGKRLSLAYLLGHILRELRGDSDDVDDKMRIAQLTVEREQAVQALRRLCGEIGVDNKWPDNLHLGDVIDKHLAPYLEE